MKKTKRNRRCIMKDASLNLKEETFLKNIQLSSETLKPEKHGNCTLGIEGINNIKIGHH